MNLFHNFLGKHKEMTGDLRLSTILQTKKQAKHVKKTENKMKRASKKWKKRIHNATTQKAEEVKFRVRTLPGKKMKVKTRRILNKSEKESLKARDTKTNPGTMKGKDRWAAIPTFILLMIKHLMD